MRVVVRVGGRVRDDLAVGDELVKAVHELHSDDDGLVAPAFVFVPSSFPVGRRQKQQPVAACRR
jgi:hypothetical protein